jgi:hypothetical protein
MENSLENNFVPAAVLMDWTKILVIGGAIVIGVGGYLEKAADRCGGVGRSVIVCPTPELPVVDAPHSDHVPTPLDKESIKMSNTVTPAISTSSERWTSSGAK